MSVSKKSEFKIKTLTALTAVGVFLFVPKAIAQGSKIEQITNNASAKQMADQLETQTEPPPSNSNTSYGTTSANDLNRHSLGIGVGQTFLNGEFKELANSSITADLYYAYSASYSFDFMANLHYWTQDKGQTKVRTLGIAPAIKGKFYQFDNFSPYALGGLGFYNPQVKRYINNAYQESESTWVFGYHFGAGAELKLNEKVSIGALVHFHNPFDVKQDNGADVEGSYQKLLLTSFYTF